VLTAVVVVAATTADVTFLVISELVTRAIAVSPEAVIPEVCSGRVKIELAAGVAVVTAEPGVSSAVEPDVVTPAAVSSVLATASSVVVVLSLTPLLVELEPVSTVAVVDTAVTDAAAVVTSVLTVSPGDVPAPIFVVVVSVDTPGSLETDDVTSEMNDAAVLVVSFVVESVVVTRGVVSGIVVVVCLLVVCNVIAVSVVRELMTGVATVIVVSFIVSSVTETLIMVVVVAFTACFVVVVSVVTPPSVFPEALTGVIVVSTVAVISFVVVMRP